MAILKAIGALWLFLTMMGRNVLSLFGLGAGGGAGASLERAAARAEAAAAAQAKAEAEKPRPPHPLDEARAVQRAARLLVTGRPITEGAALKLSAESQAWLAAVQAQRPAALETIARADLIALKKHIEGGEALPGVPTAADIEHFAKLDARKPQVFVSKLEAMRAARARGSVLEPDGDLEYQAT